MLSLHFTTALRTMPPKSNRRSFHHKRAALFLPAKGRYRGSNLCEAVRQRKTEQKGASHFQKRRNGTERPLPVYPVISFC